MRSTKEKPRDIALLKVARTMPRACWYKAVRYQPDGTRYETWLPGLFHGFFQYACADKPYPVAVIEDKEDHGVFITDAEHVNFSDHQPPSEY